MFKKILFPFLILILILISSSLKVFAEELKPYWHPSFMDSIEDAANYILESYSVSPLENLGNSYEDAKNFVNTLFTNDYPVEFVLVDKYNKDINYLYLTEEDLINPERKYYLEGFINSRKQKTVGYSVRLVRYSLTTLKEISSGTLSGNFYVGEPDKFLKINSLDFTLLGYDNYFKPDLGDDDHSNILPPSGNGIVITEPLHNSDYNSFETDKGYPVTFKVRGRYKMDYDLWAGDEADKMQIVNNTTSINPIEILNFKWIKSPTQNAFGNRIVEYEMTIKTYFKELGKNKIDIRLMMDVDKDSDDFAREHRYYEDEITINLISDENLPDSSIPGSGDDWDSFPTPPEGGSILEWIKYFGDVIIWLVTYPFRLLSYVFSVLIGYITQMVSTLKETSQAISNLFSFIPKDILNVTYGVISFTVLYSVVRGVLKLIRG